MGNFEKLSVLVIGVIIVMILVVALYTWTDDPAGDLAQVDQQEPSNETVLSAVPPGPRSGPEVQRQQGGWPAWDDPDETQDPERRVEPVSEEDLDPKGEEPSKGAGKPAESVEQAPVTLAKEKTVRVKKNETLSDIALRELGRASRWKLIADRNGIEDPAKIRIDQVLIIPVMDREQPDANKPVRIARGSGNGPKPGAPYTVQSGDTMEKLSQRAFGTLERWEDIWLANIELIDDPRVLRPGTTIQIPL